MSFQINDTVLCHTAQAIVAGNWGFNKLSRHIEKSKSLDVLNKLSHRQALMFLMSTIGTGNSFQNDWFLVELSRTLNDVGWANIPIESECGWVLDFSNCLYAEVKDDHIIIPVQVETEDYDGIVYDYCVPDGNAFMTTFVVHNSYETSHKVWVTAPREAEIMGAELNEQVAFFLGEPTYMSRISKAESQIGAMRNSILESLSPQTVTNYPKYAYDPYKDLSSQVDAVINGPGGGLSPVLIRPISRLQSSISELNTFLNMRNMQSGILMSVDEETGEIRRSIIRRDTQRFMRDYQQQEYAGQMAQQIMMQREKEGYTDNHAGMYSRVNRLKILGDVAMYSSDFKLARSQVRSLEDAGMLSPEQSAMVKTIDEQVALKKEKYTFTKYRFINQGTAATVEEQAAQNRIDREYNFMEQAVGGTWEYLSHLRSPLHSKLIHHQDVLEAYSQAHVYGREFKMWSSPYDDFIRPYVDTMISEKDPVQSAISWGLGGFLFGNPIVATAAALGGGVYGATNRVTGIGDGIPEYRQRQRDINAAFDAVEYQKNMSLFQKTGNPVYYAKAGSTMTGTLMSDKQVDATKLEMMSDAPERHFIREMAKLGTLEERTKAMALLPEAHGRMLQRYWYGTPTSDIDNMSDMLGQFDMPPDSWEGFRPETSLEDIKVKQYEEEGLNAHDVGLGWYRQLNRIKRNPTLPSGLTQGEVQGSTVTGFTGTQLESMVANVLADYSPRVTVSDDGSQRVSVTIVIE